MIRRYLVPTSLGAFLLFALQPMAGKRVLPLFGGGPAVWTTCMLLFQALLLAGYAYAHVSVTRLSRRAQMELHIVLLLASLGALLRIGDADAWTIATLIAARGSDPVVAILRLLLGTIGLPYFVLASTAPLIQSWVASSPGATGSPGATSPYRLYALSNAASFFALLSYPFLVEPWITLRLQFRIWSALYSLYIVSMIWCAVRAPAAVAPSTTGRWKWRYVALSAVGSMLLLAVTNQMCQEVAVIPFLWILPLALYLLTFTICFDHDRWYDRRLWGIVFAIAAPVACAVLALGIGAPLIVHLIADAAVLFAACMICHGELARLKPDPSALTGFYLSISAGGVLGGVLVAIVAPRVFTAFTEFPLALALVAAIALDAWWRNGAFAGFGTQPMLIRSAIAGIALAGLLAVVAATEKSTPDDGSVRIRTVRNFYGVLRVSDTHAGALRELAHGRILHGVQFRDAARADWPTAYYGPESGIALAMRSHPRRAAGKPLHIGVIGLGAGTIAAHGLAGDTIRFYEINPAVDDLSRDLFTFRRDSKARINVALGDARVTLSREAPQDYDIIAVDAFSGDAIPAHLLTVECADLYRRHLNPDGLLLFHISNRSLNLVGVVRAIASHLGWRAVPIINAADANHAASASTWMIVTGNEAFWENPDVQRTVENSPTDDTPPLLWTDDFTSLLAVLK